MPVVFVIAVLAVLAGVFFAATGRGGELAYEQTDHAPLDLGPVSAPEIALLRPPTALWGYNMQVTDEALDHIARAVRDRDITIAYLQEELASREPGNANAPTRPDACYPLTGPDDHPQAGPDPYPLADSQTSRYPGDVAPSAAGPGSTAPSDAGVPDTVSDFEPASAVPSGAGPTDTVPSGAGPALPASEAPPPPRSNKPPGFLVASPPSAVPRPPEVPEASEDSPSAAATQPYHVAEAHEATQPSQTLPATDDTLGPQGPFDTHDWWAEQEEAAREDARRQAEAQHADLTSSGEPQASEPPADALSGSAPATGPAKPLTPHDDGLSVAEEQAW